MMNVENAQRQMEAFHTSNRRRTYLRLEFETRADANSEWSAHFTDIAGG